MGKFSTFAMAFVFATAFSVTHAQDAKADKSAGEKFTDKMART